MFGKKTIQKDRIEIETRICKYCSSNNIEALETGTAFGGVYVVGRSFKNTIYFCNECGKITPSKQFKRRFEDES